MITKDDSSVHRYFKILFQIGLILFCITLPLSIKLNNMSIGLIILGWLGESTWAEKLDRIKENKLVLILPVYYFISGLTLLYSENIPSGLRILESQIKLVIFPVILGSANSLRYKQINQIKLSWIIGNVLLGVGLLCYAYIQYKREDSTIYFFYHELTDPINHLNAIYFANFLALAAVFAFVYPVPKNKDSLIVRIAKTMIIVFGLILIFMLSALTVMIFVVIMSFFLVNTFLMKRLGFWKSQAISIVVLSLISLTIISIPYTRNKIARSTNLYYQMDFPDSSWNSVTIRLAKWTCGVEVIRDNALLGVGIGDEMDELMKSYAREGFSEGIRCEYNVHNQYLSSMMSGGVFVFTALVLMLATGIREAIKQRDIVILAFIILMLLTFLTENFLRLQKGVTFFSFFFTLLLLTNSDEN